jgi:hypothetical protein
VNSSGLDAIENKPGPAERQEAQKREAGGCRAAVQVCGAQAESVVSEVIDGWGITEFA